MDVVEGSGSKRVNDGGESSSKRARGKPFKIAHFHDQVGPTHFVKVILAPGLDLLPIPDGFRPFLGNMSRTIVLKTNTGCSWMVKLRDVSGRICLEQGWPGFAIAHQVKIGFFLTFKMLKGDMFKVTIFDYTMTKDLKKCPQHDSSLAMIDM
uniref:Uncharacterized protein n=1 Tax=Avena sativa TaxID=4498 RepID=A0ACD5WJ99_AVESA